jgi:hypothetical protein
VRAPQNVTKAWHDFTSKAGTCPWLQSRGHGRKRRGFFSRHGFDIEFGVAFSPVI